MKKIVKYMLFLIVLFIPLKVNALVSEVDYDVKALYVDATINNNGSMNVRELIVLDGDFNGYERELLVGNKKLTNNDVNFEHSAIYNPSDIKLLNVSAKRLNQKINYNLIKEDYGTYKQVNYDAKGTNGNYYYYIGNNNEKIIRTYNSCESCKVGFYYEYLVEDVVVIHNDVAELYYEFIGDMFLDKIKDVEIHVSLPNTDSSSNFRVWAHGNLEGKIDKKNNNEIIATISNLKKNNTLDIRTTFDKSLITNTTSLIKTSVTALDKILEVEEKRAEEANNERKRIKRIYYGIQVSALIYVILLIVYTIYIALKYDKEYKSDFDHQYNREFIDEYDVEIIDYLMNKNVTSNAMSASIMNMIYKKNIEAEEKGKKDYVFTLKNRDNLSDAENKLVDFLFDKIGNGTTFSIKELKDYAKGTKTYNTFTSSYESWKNLVLAKSKKEGFYEEHMSTRVFGALYSFLGFVISFISITVIGDFALSHLTLIPAIIFLIYILAFKKRTIRGNNHYKRWNAFKNFLNDFGTFDAKELPEIILWERYLVYAVIFGLATKVQKAMNVKINEMQVSDENLAQDIYINSHLYYHFNLGNVINSAVSSAVSSAISTAAAQSASSSGSGHGGGFSSGGGFGGGGGGGHGF